MKKSTKVAIYSIILLAAASCIDTRRADVAFCGECKNVCADAGVNECAFETPDNGSFCRCVTPYIIPR